MKLPQSFAEAVSPHNIKHSPTEREKFEMISLQVFPILSLDKEYERYCYASYFFYT